MHVAHSIAYIDVVVACKVVLLEPFFDVYALVISCCQWFADEALSIRALRLASMCLEVNINVSNAEWFQLLLLCSWDAALKLPASSEFKAPASCPNCRLVCSDSHVSTAPTVSAYHQVTESNNATVLTTTTVHLGFILSTLQFPRNT
jgi:hypothetical protein